MREGDVLRRGDTTLIVMKVDIRGGCLLGMLGVEFMVWLSADELASYTHVGNVANLGVPR